MDDDFPEDGYGAGPADEGEPLGQDPGYEEAEDLDPDESLADPAVAA